MGASGAVNAALALSENTAGYCELDIVKMSDRERVSRRGATIFTECACSNPLNFTKGYLPNKFRTLLFRSRIPKIVRDGEYDLVHLHNPIPALEMERIAKACNEMQTPYVISTHGFVELASEGKAYGLSRWYEKQLWRYTLERPLNRVVEGAARIFALSPFELPILHDHYQVNDARIRIVTNGVNESYFDSVDHATQKAVAQRFGLPWPKPTDVPAAIYLGNHTANKGLNVLLDAFTRLDQPFSLVICGECRDNIPYGQYAHKFGTGQTITFTNFLAEEEVKALMAYADLFTYPTLSDTLPLVILDAMAAGLPVLSTKVGGIPHQVPEGVGVLVEPGDVDAFVEAYRSLTEDRDRLAAMSERARDHVRSNFSWHEAAKAAYEAYEEIVME